MEYFVLTTSKMDYSDLPGCFPFVPPTGDLVYDLLINPISLFGSLSSRRTERLQKLCFNGVSDLPRFTCHPKTDLDRVYDVFGCQFSSMIFLIFSTLLNNSAQSCFARIFELHVRETWLLQRSYGGSK